MGTGTIIVENVSSLKDSAITSGSEASATMADDNLLTEEPSEFWRSSSNLQSKAWFKVNNPNIGLLLADSFALVGHNLIRGDQYRVASSGVSDSVVQEQGYTSYDPNGTVAALCDDLADTVNSHLLVDNGETAPGATWLTGDTPTNDTWAIGLDFPTPAYSLKLGADRQAFWVYAKVAAASSSATIIVRVYDGASPVGSNITRPVSSLTGQWLCFPFDASLLADPAGAALKVKITAQNILSPTADISIGSVTLGAEFGNNTYGYDSGWITLAGGSEELSFLPQAVGNQSLLHESDTLLEGVAFYVYIRSSRAPLDYNRKYEITPSLPGFVQVGCFVFGEGWSPTHDRGHGPYIGTLELSSKGITDGGQVFGARRPVLRTLSWPLAVLSKQEARTIFDRVIWRNGMLKKYFVHLNPGDAVEGEHAGFMATLKGAEYVMSTTPATEGNRSITLEFVEAL